MRKNYERYRTGHRKRNKRRSIVSYLVGEMNTVVVSKAVGSIEGKKILELGAGTGRYTKLYYKKNQVKCIDINPHLFDLKDVDIIKGDACHFGEVLEPGETFDYIVSFFMTEYIDEDSIIAILECCSKHLKDDGRVLCTFITNGLLGNFYINGARLKGIRKYKYSHSKITSFAQSAQLVVESISPIKRSIFEMGRLYEFKKNAS